MRKYEFSATSRELRVTTLGEEKVPINQHLINDIEQSAISKLVYFIVFDGNFIVASPVEWTVYMRSVTFNNSFYEEGCHVFLNSCLQVEFIGTIPTVALPEETLDDAWYTPKARELPFEDIARLYASRNRVEMNNVILTESDMRKLMKCTKDRVMHSLSCGLDIGDIYDLRLRIVNEIRLLVFIAAGLASSGSKAQILLWGTGDGSALRRIWRFLHAQQ